MTYEIFKARVSRLCREQDPGTAPRFYTEDGQHVARCTGGITIIGNVECERVMVRWGSGHSALASI